MAEKEEKKMKIQEKLSKIQNEMKVPKNLFNKFGNYYYRNAETILEAAKPICSKFRTTLIVTDAIVNVEGRFYVKSIATLYDWDSDDILEGQAMAREEDSKKGMDGSQITGACSSYARKYALNGLFNLDDVKDADADETPKTEEKAPQVKDEVNIEEMRAELTTLYTIDELDKILQHYKVDSIKNLDGKLVIQYYRNKVRK